MHCLELVYNKNYSNFTKIFLRLFKMATNNTECFRLKQRSVIKFLVDEKCEPYEIYRRMYMYVEAFFLVKMFVNGLNMGLPWWTWVEKIAHGVKTYWLSSKEKSSRCSGQ